ncbi:MAG: translation initiation factor IF-2 [candidate division KSB1 bacterium]|nr:translation initiation factor IF-2 [candidate division KSB1 bacterium]
MSKKLRIPQVAKEFNISIDALISFLRKLNFDVHSHMSPVTEEMYEEIKKKFAVGGAIAEDDSDIKRQLKEKKAIEEEKKRKELQEFEAMLKVSSKVMTEIPRRRRTAAKTERPGTLVPSEEESVVIEEPTAPTRPEVEPVPVPAMPAEPNTIAAPAAIASEARIEEAEIADTVASTQIVEKTPAPMVEPPVPEVVPSDKELKPAVKLRAMPEIVPETPPIAPKIKEPVAKPTVEKEKKVFRKADEKRTEPTIEQKTEEQLQALKKKKLKKKERIALFRKFDDLEQLVAPEEVLPKKKKKKKKKLQRLEEGELVERPKRKAKKKKRFVVSEAEVEESIRQTFAAMQEAAHAKKRRKKIRDTDEELEEEANILRVNEFISVGELATEIGVESSDVIKKCLELGMLVTINQRLDQETIQIVADEFGYQVEIIPEFGSDILEEEEEEDDPASLQPRSPVVTIMGHVDHGKTSLLDYIRKSNIIAQEAGGITQHIGAYQVNVDSKMITFLDTPGHEAFTAMRARGAQATDIVVLVVAADDSVMPQTIEAIDHAKAAGVPIVVALNKVDKPNLNIDLIKKQLADNGVLIEEWGGKYQCVEVSAKTGQGIDKLLESILVEAEILELAANPNRRARGVVIESKLDKGKGVVATVLVQTGTLRIGDPFLVGQYSGKVRGLFDEFGNKRTEAGPSVPIQVIGFSGLPQAGDTFIVLESERDTREISLVRQQVRREKEYRSFHHLTLDEISRQIKKGGVKELSLIIKGDVDGSVEAISDSLAKLSTEEVAVRIIRKGVGAITDSDVLLASASNAIIIGFQVRPTINAREIAEKEKVDIRLYKVIYDALADVKNALEGLLEPTIEEENLSTVEVRKTFRIPKIGTIAGCYVLSGKISRNDLVRLYREDKLIYEGRLTSLKRFKDDAREVVSGYECGIGLENFDDIKVGDIIESYKLIEVKRTLTPNQVPARA